ncbi:MAG: hypothetical protein DRP45_11035 [Candidatus Zixiibacteriota bacterium]|nr:MAG: hypothetical protein DRP45_11035 [candidate division Zixibacteria bacterium]
MKKIAAILIVVLTFLATGVRGEFVQGASDSLYADTIGIEFTLLPHADSEQMNMQLDLWGFNDGDDLAGVGVGFTWDNPNLVMDSALASPMIGSSCDYIFLYKYNDIEETNSGQQFMFASLRTTSTGILKSPERRLWASYYFTLTDWNAGDSIVIDTMEYYVGTKYMFIDPSIDVHRPYFAGSVVGYDTPPSCCVGATGNVDCSESEIADGSDLSVLINHLFVTFEELCCEPEADMIAPDGQIDGGDLSALIDHLFIHPEIPLRDCL